MRATLVVLVWLASIGVARADAVMPFDGPCPPGLTPSPSHTGGVCTPRQCGPGVRAACPTGSTCRSFGECVAMRTRSWRTGTYQVEERVGLCDAQGQCAEGRCNRVHQCEPTAPSRAWDRAAHEWRGRHASLMTGSGLAIAIALVAARKRRAS
jgi:hypothetical protein